MPKKVLVALPAGLLEQVDFIAKCEHRTRSDLIRESLRRYIDSFKRNHPAAVSYTADKIEQKLPEQNQEEITA